jgi:hypothetical protein
MVQNKISGIKKTRDWRAPKGEDRGVVELMRFEGRLLLTLVTHFSALAKLTFL